jgi:hypothetical protein
MFDTRAVFVLPHRFQALDISPVSRYTMRNFIESLDAEKGFQGFRQASRGGCKPGAGRENRPLPSCPPERESQ